MLAFCRLSDTMVESLYAVIYAIQFFFTLLSIYVMKSSRRKDMLAYGLFLLSVAFVCLGSTSYVHATTSPLPMAYAPVVQVTLVPASTVLALTGFAFSVSSLLITSSSMSFVIEVLPCDSRSRGVSIAMSAAWTVETLASTLSVGLSNLNPFVFFFVLSTICFVGMIVVLFVYEERVNKEGLPFPVAVLGHGPDQEKAEDPEGPEGLAELGGPEGQGGPEDLEGPDCPENLQGPKGLVGLDDPNTQQFVAENANSETLETGSVSEKIFHPQNFITIHKRSAEDVPTNLPKFVVTEPVQMATAKSELSVLEMKTADTRFHSKFPDPAAHLEDPDRDRLVATNEVNRLAPYKTSDSKVTVSGMWSEVSDPDY
ncbi:hypothetical protein JCM33374_g2661 [Metschnikowia sp. JCM 33374]|nr:hypothetical protein JCM33374_g2661 [Metschnikowia sp. JCM 33374]